MVWYDFDTNRTVPCFRLDNIAKFVNAGIRACRKVNADIPIMIHLDNGGNNELYVRWFTNFIERGEEFEYIGLSYYPFWHGSLDQLEFNMNDIAKRFNKDLIIAEVSMGFTMDSYQEYEKLADSERKGYATKPELVEKIDYPMTIEGQADFTKDFLNRVVCKILFPITSPACFYLVQIQGLRLPHSFQPYPVCSLL